MHTKILMSLTKILQKAFSSFALFAIFLNLSLAFLSPVGAFAQTPAATDGTKAVPGKSILCPGGNCPGIGSASPTRLTTTEGLGNFIIGIAQFLTFLAVALAVLMMVYGGIRYITSNGAEQATAGQAILTNAAIGLVIAIVAYTVVYLISQVVNGNFFGTFVSGFLIK